MPPAHPLLPARLADLCIHPAIPEQAGYLHFAETGYLHVETPSEGTLSFRGCPGFQGYAQTPASELSRGIGSRSVHRKAHCMKMTCRLGRPQIEVAPAI